jgi:hypothetical protein
MDLNLLPTVQQAITHLLTVEPAFLRFGYGLFLSFATILIAWQGKFQLPKTRRALRTIPLGRQAVAALTSHGERVTRRPRVRQSQGDPLRESKLLTNVLQPAAARAGLGRVTWHQFRHIHSSLLNDLKVPRSNSGTPASRRPSTSTHTSLTRRIGRQLRRSKSDCSARWTVWTEVGGWAGMSSNRK